MVGMLAHEVHRWEAKGGLAGTAFRAMEGLRLCLLRADLFTVLVGQGLQLTDFLCAQGRVLF